MIRTAPRRPASARRRHRDQRDDASGEKKKKEQPLAPHVRSMTQPRRSAFQRVLGLVHRVLFLEVYG